MEYVLLVSSTYMSSPPKFITHVTLFFVLQSAKITKGQSFVSIYYDAAQDSLNALTRVFCSRCSSPLYIFGGDGKSLSVFYSALDDFEEVVDSHSLERGVDGEGGKADKTEGEAEVGTKEKWKTAVMPKLEYYVKDRLSWVAPVQGAEQANTRPDRA